MDIVNVSAGVRWFGPAHFNPYSEIARKAIDSGITVVAAAGNKDDERDFEPVNCPAALTDVIAVGGLVSECPTDPREHEYDTGEEMIGPYLGATTTTPNCAYQECIDSSSCITNQIERPWSGNPDPVDSKPDILAPIAYPSENGDGEIELYGGTSYAAPVVSGTLGIIFGELAETGISLPTPTEARIEIIRQSVPIDEGSLNKPNIIRTMKELSST